MTQQSAVETLQQTGYLPEAVNRCIPFARCMEQSQHKSVNQVDCYD